MWLERIKDLQRKQQNYGSLSHLNFRCELHLCIYMCELLHDIIRFELKENKLIIKLVKENKNLTQDQFLYWWQITRHNDIFKEEVALIKSVTNLQEGMQKINELISKIENSNKGAEEIEVEVKKLTNKYNQIKEKFDEKSPIIKKEVKLLEGIRNSFPNKEIIDLVLDIMKIYLKNK